MAMFILIFLIVIGLCVGSCVEALVWRLHMRTEAKLNNIANKKVPQFSILTGRSVCPNCYHKLSPIDLVPVLSWLLLRAKCRYCKKPLSWQYPVLELLMALI